MNGLEVGTDRSTRGGVPYIADHTVRTNRPDTLIWRATLLTELRVVLTDQGKLADGRLYCPTPEPQ